MSRLHMVSNGVFRISADRPHVTTQDLSIIKADASTNGLGRSRICAHPSDDSMVHEMFIALNYDNYVRPHMHLKKSESYFLIDGEVSVLAFADSGSVERVVTLSSSNAQKPKFCRIEAGIWHTLVIETPQALIHEVTSGPFKANDCKFAHFAPAACNLDSVSTYQSELRLLASIG